MSSRNRLRFVTILAALVSLGASVPCAAAEDAPPTLASLQSVSVVRYQHGIEEQLSIPVTPYFQQHLPPYVPPGLPRQSGGDSKSLERVYNTDTYPWSTICHIRSLDQNGAPWTCSGATSDSFHILTAGHCLYDPLGWHYSVAVACGEDEEYRPFGVAWDASLTVSTDWYNDPSDDNDDQDWGWIILDRQKGNSTGWMGLEYADDCDWFEGSSFNFAGYPYNYCNQDCMYQDFGECYDCYDTLIFLSVENYGGMSGGPFWSYHDDNRYKVGVFQGWATKGLEGGRPPELVHFSRTSDGDEKYSAGYGVRFTTDLVNVFLDSWANDPTPPDDWYSDWCPGSNFPDRCCMTDDPCGWANDGYCDCGNQCDWDNSDCEPDWCPGYTGTNECCQASDPCDWANDGVCDCDSTCDWDNSDCEPDWCPGYTGNNECCQVGDPCDWSNDGTCDCNGACSWDSADCEPDPEWCPDYNGSNECCQVGDPCNWSNNGTCNCNGDCQWDDADCESGGDWCPGYTGSNECCQTGDPCDLSNDGNCQCQSHCNWDHEDCSGSDDDISDDDISGNDDAVDDDGGDDNADDDGGSSGEGDDDSGNGCGC